MSNYYITSTRISEDEKSHSDNKSPIKMWKRINHMKSMVIIQNINQASYILIHTTIVV